MYYFIKVEKDLKNTAGIKAPDDIEKISEELGMKEIRFPKFPFEKNKVIQKLWLFCVVGYNWISLLWRLKKNDVVIYQHPMYGVRVANFAIPLLKKYKNIKFISVIHDLESLRKGIQGVIEDNETTNAIADKELLSKFDKVISHNPKMTEYLEGIGIKKENLVELQIFDYLDPSEIEEKIEDGVVIAGNLAKGKSSYIYKLLENELNFKLNLFGPNFINEELPENVEYFGSLPPNKLPQKLVGKFGLVWDGDSLETCSGNTGNYLKYNNPHKASLYLASGIPVIIWKEAALAQFIEENNVGITVNNLSEIEFVMQNISEGEYLSIKRNIMQLGEKLRNGYFYRQAISKCKNDFMK
ncbi:glycosyltransferase [Streptococcus pneumoniae]|uniref:glycosyltransferase n=1 Tax=Streptococcus pneumoniae TaxID=1313 RepID=UPI001CC93ACC|nr:glycosyltransferase [Streptococcus pneumoniae]MBZ8107758.1 glycosyltransferase [Streptococcus pneumoniae]